MILALFPNFETEVFPAGLCTVPNDREDTVLDSPPSARFLCVLVDCRWPRECTVKVLRPYTADDVFVTGNKAYLYGWVDESGNYVDHKERSVHGDDCRVVAWRPMDEHEVVRFGPDEWPDEVV